MREEVCGLNVSPWQYVGDDITDGVVVHDAGVSMQESSLKLEAMKVANTCNTLGIRDA